MPSSCRPNAHEVHCPSADARIFGRRSRTCSARTAPAVAAGACIGGSAAPIGIGRTTHNKAAFRKIVKRRTVAGLLAFDGDVAVGWCQLTPRDALAVARSRVAARARGRRVCLVALVLLRAQRLPPARCHGRADRGSAESRRTRQGARPRGLSPGRGEDAERVGHRLCLDLQARRIQDDRAPCAATANHAARFAAESDAYGSFATFAPSPCSRSTSRP